ncbi:MAG: hypothetical protein MJE66_18540, partial [Proteobacteria bacterium]|nr:hypothetical protein [Pseudomonadota bacterium]
IVVATVSEGAARWDGQTQSFATMGDGTIAAISLWLTIYDHEGREIFFRAGGLHTLGRFEGMRFEPIEPEQVLGLPLKTMQAVLEALGPLRGPEPENCIQHPRDATGQRRRDRIARCEWERLRAIQMDERSNRAGEGSPDAPG